MIDNSILFKKEWYNYIMPLEINERLYLLNTIFDYGLLSIKPNTFSIPTIHFLFLQSVFEFLDDKKNKLQYFDKYHWNYKGGVSQLNTRDRCSAKMKHWRKIVFERDNYTCRICYNTGVVLNAHHILPFAEYPELRFEVDNGLTLCKPCHISVHKTRTKND